MQKQIGFRCVSKIIKGEDNPRTGCKNKQGSDVCPRDLIAVASLMASMFARERSVA